MKHSKIAAVVFSLGLMLSCISVAHAEDGVTGSEILLGQSCALEGPAQALGIGMKTGMEVYFAQNPKWEIAPLNCSRWMTVMSRSRPLITPRS